MVPWNWSERGAAGRRPLIATEASSSTGCCSTVSRSTIGHWSHALLTPGCDQNIHVRMATVSYDGLTREDALDLWEHDLRRMVFGEVASRCGYVVRAVLSGLSDGFDEIRWLRGVEAEIVFLDETVGVDG